MLNWKRIATGALTKINTNGKNIRVKCNCLFASISIRYVGHWLLHAGAIAGNIWLCRMRCFTNCHACRVAHRMKRTIENQIVDVFRWKLIRMQLLSVLWWLWWPSSAALQRFDTFKSQISMVEKRRELTEFQLHSSFAGIKRDSKSPKQFFNCEFRSIRRYFIQRKGIH